MPIVEHGTEDQHIMKVVACGRINRGDLVECVSSEDFVLFIATSPHRLARVQSYVANMTMEYPVGISLDDAEDGEELEVAAKWNYTLST